MTKRSWSVKKGEEMQRRRGSQAVSGPFNWCPSCLAAGQKEIQYMTTHTHTKVTNALDAAQVGVKQPENKSYIRSCPNDWQIGLNINTQHGGDHNTQVVPLVYNVGL